MRKLSKDEFVALALEYQRKKKKQYMCNDADIHAIRNSERIRKRTRPKRGVNLYET